MKVLVFLISLCVVFSSCSNAPVTNKDMNGKSEEVIIKEYGKPMGDHLIKLTKSSPLHEYQRGLASIYPNLTGQDTVYIRELNWNLNARLNHMAVWFENKGGRWVVVDNLRWPDSIKF